MIGNRLRIIMAENYLNIAKVHKDTGIARTTLTMIYYNEAAEGKKSEEHDEEPIERIEDEYDLTIANKAYDEYLREGKQSRPIERLWQELEL